MAAPAQPSAPSTDSRRPRPSLPGQFLDSDDDTDDAQQFWDVLTSADRSPSASPPPGGARAPTAPAGRIASRHVRDASFSTAFEFGASASRDQAARLESRTPTPVAARSQSERQRWPLPNGRGGETPASLNTATLSEAQQFNSSPPLSEDGHTVRRDPVSVGSHGPATDDGPSPAHLNARDPTSRTLLYSGVQPLKRLASRGGRNSQDVDAVDTGKSEDPREGHTHEEQVTLSPNAHNAGSVMEGRPRSSRWQSQDLVGQTQAQNGTLNPEDAQLQESAEDGTEGHSSEDLFLNLARENPSRRVDLTQDNLERKRSRLKRGGQRQSLPTSQLLSRADSSDHESAYGPPSAFENNQRVYSRRPSQVASIGLGGYREASPVSTASRIEGSGRQDQYRQRYIPSQRAQSVVAGPTSPEASSHTRRRPSLSSELPSPGYRGQAYRPSRLNNNIHSFDSSSAIDTPHGGRQRAPSMTNGEGNDSVISGPSAVWDELEELKSRIKRMERNGVAASASGAAVQSSASGSNERPRTATTTVTTISSSPKHNRNPRKVLSPSLSSANEDGDAMQSVYPLLHQALARCKSVLSPSVYRVLEAMATEAIEMVALTGGGGSQGPTYSAASVIGGAAVADRQIRRKGDNMCRTVTELCIALCEQTSALSRSGGSMNSPSVIQSIEQRPSSKRGQPTSPEAYEESPASGAYARHALRSASLEPEGTNGEVRSTPSRALSRIDARRNSVNVSGLSSSSAANSPREPRVSEVDEPPSEEGPTPLQRVSSIPNRFSRAGTSLLRSRRRPAAGDEEPDDDPTIRPMSRAMTDIGTASPREAQLRVPSLRERPNHRLSREYTSSEPLPEHAAAPLASHGSLRRVTGTHLPQTSLLRQGDAGRRFQERNAPPVAYESGDRARVPSSGLFSGSRRTSTGVSSLAAGRKQRMPGLTVDTGPGEQ